MCLSTMCKMLLLDVLFLTFIQLSSAAEISEISLPSGELQATEGSYFIIPCLFRVESPTAESKVDVEWGRRSDGERGYTSIIHLYADMLEPVDHHNERAQVFVSHLPRGDCSLVIDPITTADSGTYELRLRIDGRLHHIRPTIKINVFKRQGFSSTNQGSHKIGPPKEAKFRSLNNFNKELGNAGLSATALSLARAIMFLKKNGYLLYVEIAGGILLGLLVLGSIAGCIFGILYWRLHRRIRDEYKITEKSLGSPTNKTNTSLELFEGVMPIKRLL